MKKPEPKFVIEQNPPVRFLSLKTFTDEKLDTSETSRNDCFQSTMAFDDDELDGSVKKTIKERLRSQMSRRGGKSNRNKVQSTNSDVIGVAPRAAHTALPLSVPLTATVWVTLGTALSDGSA